MKYADLHIHTYYSDGTNSPKQVIDLCKKAKIDVMAITDHDSIQGLLEAINLPKKNIKLIKGVEITGKDSEVLAYNIDIENSELNYLLSKNIKTKKKIILSKVDKLKDINIDIEIEDVYAEAKSENILSTHIAMALCKKGITKTIQEAFTKYIMKIRNSEKTIQTNTKKIIKIIKNADGLAVLPHPFFSKNYYKEKIYDYLQDLKECGLNGVETTYSHSNEDLEFHKKLKHACKDLNLFETGGSDFHDANYFPRNIIGKHKIDFSKIEKYF